MREILFRAKQVNNGEWVHGFYMHHSEQKKDYILTGRSATYQVSVAHPHLATQGFEWFEVEPSTIGQFTGLTDKNGTKIFEGDIVNVIDIWWGGKYEVYWWGKDSSFKFTRNRKTYLCMDTGIESGCTIVGNIYDNPELLKKENK